VSTEDNKALVRRMFDLINQGSLAVLDEAIAEVFAPTWVNHDPSLPPLEGLAGARQLIGMFESAFPGLQMQLEDLLAEGDKVAARFRLSGTHGATFQGIQATGKTVSVTGTGILRIENGQIAENWVTFDSLGLMRQLGLIAAPGQ
jgi:predicted ester cyclase